MTTLESISLSGQYELKDVSGEVDFAMGRWVKGTVTLAGTSSGKSVITTLTGQDAGSLDYLVFNEAKNLPQTGARACDAGTFTTPTYEGGESGAHSNSGTATGSAGLSFEVGRPRMGGEIVSPATSSTVPSATARPYSSAAPAPGDSFFPGKRDSPCLPLLHCVESSRIDKLRHQRDLRRTGSQPFT